MGERRRLLVVVTGSVTAAFAPHHLAALARDPRVEVRVVVTASALRFVTAHALAAFQPGTVLVDSWDDGRAHHVELAEWADAALVHPCTFDYVTRLAAGDASRPSLLALHTAGVPVVLAPALPPGGAESGAYLEAVRTLAARGQVVVAPPAPGISTSTGSREAGAPAPFAVCASLALGRAETTSGPAAGVVHHASNDHLAITVRDAGASFLLERTPASPLVAALRSPGPPPHPRRASFAGGLMRVSWATEFAAGLVAPVRGPTAASRWLTSGERALADTAAQAVATAVEYVDGASRVLRDCDAVVDGRPPLPIARLGDHLDRVAGDDGPSGEPIEGLRRLLDEYSSAAALGTAAFGDFGLGSLFPAVECDPGAVDLVVGEAPGVAPPGHDLGWLLGELAELRSSGYGAGAVEGLLEAVCARLGEDGAIRGAVVAAVSRIALHALDYVTYASGDDRDVRSRWRLVRSGVEPLLAGDPPAALAALRRSPADR